MSETSRPRFEIIFGDKDKESPKTYKSFSRPDNHSAMSYLPVTAMMRMGLPNECVPTLFRHLNDLNIVYQVDGPNRVDQNTHLTVRFGKDSDETDGQWKRYLIIANKELEQRLESLDTALSIASQKNYFQPVQKKILGAIATNWIYFEKSIEALANSFFMIQTFGRYVPDFNGQSSHYETEKEISAAYARANPDLEIDVAEDTKRLIKGFGYIVLHSDLLVRDIFRGIRYETQAADWAIGLLRANSPDVLPYSAIADRLKNLRPDKAFRKKLLELVLQCKDPE